jgi:hypothetical protein
MVEWREKREFLTLLFLMGVLLLVLLSPIWLIQAWPFMFAGLWPKIHAAMASFWVRILTVVVLLVLAFVLYLIRKFIRYAYGIGEISIGIALCWVTLSNPENNGLIVGLSLAGSVYLIVSGLDNWLGDSENFKHKT